MIQQQFYWTHGDEEKLWAYVDKVGIDEAYYQFIKAFYQIKIDKKLLFKIETSINKIVNKHGE